MPSYLSPLRERNLALYFTGQGLSFIGYWIQGTTFNWLLYQYTDSALWLGYFSAAITLPALLFLPVGGLLVDRYDRRRLLLLLQSLFMVQALALSVLAHVGLLTLPLLVAMGALQSLLSAFDGPARQAFVPALVRHQAQLPAAISFNSILTNTTRAIGPPLAGWIMARYGPAPCFLLNGLSYLCMLAALVLIHQGTPAPRDSTRARRGVLDNLRLIREAPPLRYLLLAYCAVALVTMSVYVLLPIWAHQVLGAGPQGLGWLMGGIGAGALIGAGVVGAERAPARLWPLFRQSMLLLAAALILLSLSDGLWLALLVTTLLGLAFIAASVTVNTLLQLSIDDDHRAGVMAFYLLAALGSVPLGNLLGGWLGQALGLHGAALACGLVMLAISMLSRPAGRRALAAADAARHARPGADRQSSADQDPRAG